MKIKVTSNDTMSNIMDLITYINKSNNLTALLLPIRDNDGRNVIVIESLD